MYLYSTYLYTGRLDYDFAIIQVPLISSFIVSYTVHSLWVYITVLDHQKPVKSPMQTNDQHRESRINGEDNNPCSPSENNE